MSFDIREASKTLRGHVVVLGGSLGVTLAVYGIAISNEQGTLTLSWLLWYLCLCGVVAIATTVASWFTITKPYLRRRSEEDTRRN